MDTRTFLVTSGVWEIDASDEVDACTKFLSILEDSIDEIEVVEVIKDEDDGLPAERAELSERGPEREDDTGVVVQFRPVTEDVLKRATPKDDR